MATHMPPELMTPEQREVRAAEVQHEISRQWLRFALTEVVALWIPFAVFLVMYLVTDLSDAWLIQAAVVGGIWCAVLVLYWLFRRIMPLQKELQALRGSR